MFQVTSVFIYFFNLALRVKPSVLHKLGKFSINLVNSRHLGFNTYLHLKVLVVSQSSFCDEINYLKFWWLARQVGRIFRNGNVFVLFVLKENCIEREPNFPAFLTWRREKKSFINNPWDCKLEWENVSECSRCHCGYSLSWEQMVASSNLTNVFQTNHRTPVNSRSRLLTLNPLPWLLSPQIWKKTAHFVSRRVIQLSVNNLRSERWLG